MKWLFERLYRKDKGFTLIELLIVIIILAVLAGIAIPNYLSITKRAKESGTEAEMSSIAVALEMYNADNGVYPADTTYATMTGALADYMANVPTHDKFGTADANLYVYVQTDSGAGYTLTSAGAGTDIVFTNGQQTGMGAY